MHVEPQPTNPVSHRSGPVRWSVAWPRDSRMRRQFTTAETVREMERAAKADQFKPRVRQLAVEAWAAVGGREGSQLDLVLALERAVKDGVLYTFDPLNVELITAPERLLGLPMPAGDCDCMHTLLASSGLALGLSPRLVRLDFKGDSDPDPFEHVVVQVPIEVEGRQVEVVLDATYPDNLSELLARAKRWHVHKAIGRKSVKAPGW